MAFYRGIKLVFLLLTCLPATLAQVSPPVFQKPANKEDLYFPSTDAKISVECTADGRPPPTYKWWKNGAEFNDNLNNYVSVDKTTGTLVFDGYNSREDGQYMCVATSQDPTNPLIRATSFSPVLNIRQQKLALVKGPETSQDVQEYSYFKLPCITEDSVGQSISYKWYYGTTTDQIPDMDNNRLFIDTDGTLHFTYVKFSDTSEEGKSYTCGVSSSWAAVINLGKLNKIQVIQGSADTTIPYKLEHSNSGVRVPLHTKAVLECVYGGYSPGVVGPPPIKWYDNKNRQIINNTSPKFTISSDYRQLTINTVTELDEGRYMCQAQDTPKTPVDLDVFSEPRFKSSSDRPIKQQVLPEGENAVFNCRAVSLPDETKPDPPVWYINGVQMDASMDYQKYVLSEDKKTLTIRDLKKPQDTQCVQCKVVNEEGTTWADGCVTVILAIDVKLKPEQRQEVVKGDIVDLTVYADSDESVPTLTRIWTFKNLTYTDTEPLHTTKTASSLYINTTELTEEEYEYIEGTYYLQISSPYDKVNLMFEVVRVDEPPPTPVVQSAGFPMWIIPVILGILLLILVILIIICIVCRKRQEAAYNVDEKEKGAGLDPANELKGFDDFSRPDEGDYDYLDKPRRDIPFEEDALVPNDEEESGDELEYFKEDGSFIGEYDKKERQQREPNVSNI